MGFISITGWLPQRVPSSHCPFLPLYRISKIQEGEKGALLMGL